MHSWPYINIHTHSPEKEEDRISVQNIFPGETIPPFTGRNFCSVGLHPWYLKRTEENEKLIKLIEEMIKTDHLIFIGECGLDKFAEAALSEQIKVFKAQAVIAEINRKPLIVHCVKSYMELMDIHKNINPTVPWIIHGYNGSKEITQQLMKREFFFSFGKLLLKESTRANASFKLLTPDHIFFETDESTIDIETVYQQGAKLKNISLEEMKTSIWENFNRIKNLS